MRLIFSVCICIILQTYNPELILAIEDKCNTKIYLSDYDLILSKYILNDTDRIEVSGTSRYILIVLKNCFGELELTEVEKNGEVIVKGSYIGGLDTLKKYSIATSTEPPFKQSIRIFNYFEPLKNGEWQWYRKNKLIRKEYWDKGVLKK